MELDIERLLEKGVIVRMESSRDEINGLMASAESLLAEADHLSSTDPVKAFARACDAVYSVCRSFMLSSSYRIARGPDHRPVLQFCELTVDKVSAGILRQFQAAEISRHHEMYKGRFSIDEAEAVSLIKRARILIQRLGEKS